MQCISVLVFCFFQKMSEGCRCFLSCDLDRFSRTLLADALAILELSISLVSGLSSGGGSQALMTRAFKRSRQSAVLSCWYRVFSEVTMSCPSLFIMCWHFVNVLTTRSATAAVRHLQLVKRHVSREHVFVVCFSSRFFGCLVVPLPF
uniref:Secreted protein n=1 Tax=Ixodes ricinus TaxID=34613 RepID=A0A6B0UUY7_IXORI